MSSNGAGTDRGAPDFEARHEFGNAEANLRFLDAAALVPSMRILEIGSGHGALLRQLRARGLDVRGVETVRRHIEESRRLYGELPIDHVDGVSLPYGDGEFDVVISFDVFEHIADSDGHLREVSRVLKPGGRYLLQTPNKWTNAVFETIRWRSLTAWRVDHCALHTAAQLQRRFERHGFSVRFHDVPVFTDFFKTKVRHYLGPLPDWLLGAANPDRLPVRWRTNFFVEASRQRGGVGTRA
jgi:SAM-dependent methyltransferase